MRDSMVRLVNNDTGCRFVMAGIVNVIVYRKRLLLMYNEMVVKVIQRIQLSVAMLVCIDDSHINVTYQTCFTCVTV